jgi:hypothetical protein
VEEVAWKVEAVALQVVQVEEGLETLLQLIELLVRGRQLKVFQAV